MVKKQDPFVKYEKYVRKAFRITMKESKEKKLTKREKAFIQAWRLFLKHKDK